MKPLRATESEQPEIFATVRRELPAIHRAVLKMAKPMRGLSDVSQKMAIAQMTAAWIKAYYPDNLELQLSLADAIRDQIDIDLKAAARLEGRQQQH
ncbi:MULTISPECIES: hypothetical protein [unclassified Mesorhizobium]|uniref:hypothetical protein n=1 Tax=unclassified Mesorhizobium TaxID=325217 RepID=UPI001CCB7DEC|nr:MULTISPECIES: hypothetical protein [unclassified Mesorhizobium]MBZ9739802.1 hypothetical protein [Mesorhizobium sp. CO1-1-4]MBZ9804934.1 hypothetical protein [Mesorhizobium sp. ES1-6]